MATKKAGKKKAKKKATNLSYEPAQTDSELLQLIQSDLSSHTFLLEEIREVLRAILKKLPED